MQASIFALSTRGSSILKAILKLMWFLSRFFLCPEPIRRIHIHPKHHLNILLLILCSSKLSQSSSLIFRHCAFQTFMCCNILSRIKVDCHFILISSVIINKIAFPSCRKGFYILKAVYFAIIEVDLED